MDDAAMQHDMVRRLRECLAQRDIAAGLGTLEENRRLLSCIGPERAGSAALLGYLTQWVDLGFSSPAEVESILQRFPAETRVQLAVVDYVHLRFAEGALAMWREDYDCALRHFRFITSVQEEVPDHDLVAICDFWSGRCLRKTGHYEEALALTIRARDRALDLGYSRMAAIIRMSESWLLFQKGRTTDALRILEGADAELQATDDYIARGNIESAYGRIARRQGRQDRAITHFRCAIELYQRQYADHRNVARSLVNLVVVQRQIGLDLQRKLDRELARRKSEKPSSVDPGPAARDRARLATIRTEAQAALDRADAIYNRTGNHRGLGAVHVMRGFLNLDVGKLDNAMEQANAAYRLGEEKSDHILMARTRILQCIIESSKFDEGIEEDGDPAVHAQSAMEFAREGVELALETENRRLAARAYVWAGLVWANRYYDDTEAARDCCDRAIELLRPEGQQYVWDDLRQLRSYILGNTRVDTVLREWSQGLIGDRSFQQVTEEFAAIVIPRVWERESRKVSRVAAKLSVSPKKVRRILQAAGLLRG
jgi:tetratricopeptide (TPR) repeat protein